MSVPKLRVIHDAAEIRRMLQIVHEKRLFVSIWQNILGSRVHQEGRVDHLDLEEGIFKIQLFGKFLFNLEGYLYFYAPFKTMLLKAKIKTIRNRVVVLELPQEMRALEARDQARLAFQKVEGEFKNLVVLSKTTGFRSNSRKYEKPLIDMSPTGISFVVSKMEGAHFRAGDSILIEKFLLLEEDEFTREADITGRIVYLKRIEKNGEISEYRVGVSLDSEANIQPEGPPKSYVPIDQKV